MSVIPDHVRQAVINWPDDAPRGAITKFCHHHGVSRSWFHSIRRQARADPHTAASKATTRPRTSPNQTPVGTTRIILSIRAQLTAIGSDHGPSTIRSTMLRSGLTLVPSRATIARILDREQVTEHNHRKRPRAAHRRFQALLANQRWQSDGMTIRLQDGSPRTIVEIIDDATRFNIAAHPAMSESAPAVLAAFTHAIGEYGKPVLVHTDNGGSFNSSRIGLTTELQAHLADLGIRMITGRPGHPQSQGKVERAHQTLLKFLSHRELVDDDDLRRALADYRDWYNHDRVHQALPTNTTPGEAYAASPKASPSGEPVILRPRSTRRARPGQKRLAAPMEPVVMRRAGRGGVLTYRGWKIALGRPWADTVVVVVFNQDHLEIFDEAGAFLACTVWPPERRFTSLTRQTTPANASQDCALCPET